jgi:hypothetical protein
MRKFCYTIASIALFSQLVGLIFCGDIECLQGGSNEDCAAVICGLLDSHSTTSPADDAGQEDACQCYCHWLVDPPVPAAFASQLHSTPHHLTDSSSSFSTPIRSIDHPPLA